MAGPTQVGPATPVVAIVGRPNVGKSTLVNRLTGRRDAIVEERPGVTRDRTAHAAEWRGRSVTILDTGGWLPGWAEGRRQIDEAVSAQAELATETADLVLFVVDATVGLTEEDAAVAGWLRALDAPVVLVANKADELGNQRHPEAEIAELYAAGLGDPVPVSALHGRGSGDLLDVVYDELTSAGAFDRPAAPDDDIPGVALIGRPNVGKSSLFNRLVGEQRVVVDAAPGTTRDAVDTVVRAGNRLYRFVDTAGLRRKARIRSGEATEYYSSVRTVQALDAASVAVLVIDAGEPVGEQEQKLARHILDAGRAIVVVLNKWDLVDEERREMIDRERDRLLSFVSFAPLVRTSAATGRGLDKLLPMVDLVLEEWHRRIPTAQLNDWLADAVAAHEPPLHNGRTVRLRYITQAAVGPPTFRVFSTGQVPVAYVRYLQRRLREAFGFTGTPLDVAIRVRPRWEERAEAR
jgi:GTP-binding protein